MLTSILYLDSSRPNPLFFIRPNRTGGPEIMTLFNVTIPESTIGFASMTHIVRSFTSKYTKTSMHQFTGFTAPD